MQTKIEKANDRSAQHVIQSRVTTSARQEDAFIDRRPQQSAQRKLQEIALNGALVHQQKAQVDTLQNDPQGVSQRLESAPQANRTGLPTQLKSAVESLSGMSMDNVRVHYNSTQPAQLNALAYAQGTDIHLAPGQERHLPHEAWHVVQQAQGRVRPTIQAKRGVAVNDDVHLEREADAMGARALQMHDAAGPQHAAPGFTSTASASGEAPVQRELDEEDVDRLSKYLVQILPAADSRQEESIQQALFDWLAEHLKSIHDISPELVQHHYQRIKFAQGVEANFHEAGPSKQIVQINNDYGGLRDDINGLLAGKIPGTPSFRRDVYQEEINKINADYIRNYKKLAEWVGPFKRLGRASFERDPERFNRVVQLFSWLIPLHETTVKGINNLSGIVLSLKSLLTADINLLKDNAVELPANALISNTATQSIGGY
ncbi:DUF4157 domain-containing protein, partial [Herbaspirillum sp. RV1423]|uniref:eCIS core domain-containing protein n=1 Tax=Herbaspirillum sp. RV1423 TaxID=1443993 RepID=UPI0012DFBC34